MCGRFALAGDLGVASSLPILRETLRDVRPRYNIAPGTHVTVLAYNRLKALAAVQMRWGLVPQWSRGPDHGLSLFNARVETIRQKPAFRESFERRRAVVPASGYYEWQTRESLKQPWLISAADGGMMYFAAIWDQWRAADGSVLLSAAILTMEAHESVAMIHHRMPVMLTEAESLLWMQSDLTDEKVEQLTALNRSRGLVAHAVHPRIGNSRMDGPECVEFV
ncbi:SOS response-associated peptidase [Govanella unica]|uniref:Abasic site processing protein n=1 Tax=Govanella unica TaxID=2975056 RepID=A0A9X3Z7L0_9PROT|nr:SOS response-associated peptidase [Govania unica]MDA5194163.1 SOS response-associated peptidase [Govania unica]